MAPARSEGRGLAKRRDGHGTDRARAEAGACGRSCQRAPCPHHATGITSHRRHASWRRPQRLERRHGPARRAFVILPDVNVLLYAFRRDAARHGDYRSWLETVVNGEAAYGISPQVLASVIRIGTHRRIYMHPSTTREALAFCDALLEPNTARSSGPAPATGASSRTSAGSPVRRGIWCRMRGSPRWPSNRGASGSPPIATTPAFQASAGGSRSEQVGEHRLARGGSSCEAAPDGRTRGVLSVR